MLISLKVVTDISWKISTRISLQCKKPEYTTILEEIQILFLKTYKKRLYV